MREPSSSHASGVGSKSSCSCSSCWSHWPRPRKWTPRIAARGTKLGPGTALRVVAIVEENPHPTLARLARQPFRQPKPSPVATLVVANLVWYQRCRNCPAQIHVVGRCTRYDPTLWLHTSAGLRGHAARNNIKPVPLCTMCMVHSQNLPTAILSILALTLFEFELKLSYLLLTRRRALHPLCCPQPTQLLP